jgi:hypothetical protein
VHAAGREAADEVADAVADRRHRGQRQRAGWSADRDSPHALGVTSPARSRSVRSSSGLRARLRPTSRQGPLPAVSSQVATCRQVQRSPNGCVYEGAMRLPGGPLRSALSPYRTTASGDAVSWHRWGCPWHTQLGSHNPSLRSRATDKD